MSFSLAFWRSGFWQRLFGRESSRPEPGSVVVQPPVTPVEPPVVPPVTPPVYVDLWPESLWLFCEASGANKYDLSGITPNTILVAIRGKSARGRTVRCIHPWYDPYKTEPNDTVLLSWFKEAKASGCIAMAVDWEGWCKSRNATQRFVRAAESVGIPLVLVPKWTLDPSGELYCGCTSQAQVVHLLSAWNVPALLLWLYGGDATWRRATLKSIFRDNGYAGQLIGMTDGGMREGQPGYNTVAETLEFMRLQHDDKQAVGLFNVPTDHRSLKYALSLYR